MRLETVATLDRLPGVTPRPEDALGAVSFADLLASLETPVEEEEQKVKTFAFRDLGVFGLGRAVDAGSGAPIPESEPQPFAAATPAAPAASSPEPPSDTHHPASTVIAAPNWSAPPPSRRQTGHAGYVPSPLPISKPSAAKGSDAGIASYDGAPVLPPQEGSWTHREATVRDRTTTRSTSAVAERAATAAPSGGEPEISSTPDEPSTPDPLSSPFATSRPARKLQPSRELRLNPLVLFEDGGQAGLAFQCASLSPNEFQAFRRRAETLLEEHGLALIRLSHNGKTQSKILAQGEGGASWR